MKKRAFDIIIIGGGMVGQSFALALARKKFFKIAVVEPQNLNPKMTPATKIRLSTIIPASVDFLKTIGAWDLIERKYPFRYTRVWDAGSHGRLNFDNGQNRGFVIENDCIQSALFAALQPFSPSFIRARLSRINEFENHGEVFLDDGAHLSARLIIGADGANSRLRDLAGIRSKITDYHQRALIFNIHAEHDFEKSIWQRFLSHSIVALLPFSENDAGVVWSAENPLAETLLKLPKKTLAGQLAAAVEHRFGNFEICSDIHSFALFEQNARHYVKNRIVLIGDAAHQIHPLAGQGANLGFADAWKLSSEILKNPQSALDDNDALRRYEKSRRLDNETMATTMRFLDWIYKTNNEPVRLARGFAMNAIDKIAPLKALFQNYANGRPPPR